MDMSKIDDGQLQVLREVFQEKLDAIVAETARRTGQPVRLEIHTGPRVTHAMLLQTADKVMECGCDYVLWRLEVGSTAAWSRITTAELVAQIHGES
jgi:hypothetical protein